MSIQFLTNPKFKIIRSLITNNFSYEDLLNLRLVSKLYAYNKILLNLILSTGYLSPSDFLKQTIDPLEKLIRNYFARKYESNWIFNQNIQIVYSSKHLVLNNDSYFQPKFIPPHCKSIIITTSYSHINLTHFFNNIKILRIVGNARNVIISSLLPQIKELYLTNINLYNIENYFSNSLKNLKILDLGHNCLSKVPEFIDQLPKLKILKLDNNNISVVSNLKCINIEEIDLSYNKITCFPSELLKLQFLKKLKLNDNLFESLLYSLCEFKDCYSLIMLDVRNCLKIDPKELAYLKKQNPRLKIKN